MEEIEVLDEDFIEEKKEPDIIELDRLFSDEDEEVIDVYEENLKIEEARQRKITKIQIGLIIFLAVIASIVYFFGYDIVEPYIKIE